jgi:hypothetical protein
MHVWQSRFRDDGLRTPEAVRAAVRYVLMNPVQAGLLGVAGEYRYLGWNREWLS